MDITRENWRGESGNSGLRHCGNDGILMMVAMYCFQYVNVYRVKPQKGYPWECYKVS